MVYLLSFIHGCRNRWGRGTNVVVYLHASWIICMYHGLFICTMYDSHGLKLCTMYDSHGIYLRVLWTICMYKFSRCHAVVFHGFFVPFTDFWAKPIDLSVKLANLLVKLAAFWSSRFSLLLRHLRCVSAEFSRISPIFFEFCKNRRNQWGPIFLLPLIFWTLVIGRCLMLLGALIIQPSPDKSQGAWHAICRLISPCYSLSRLMDQGSITQRSNHWPSQVIAHTRTMHMIEPRATSHPRASPTKPLAASCAHASTQSFCKRMTLLNRTWLSTVTRRIVKFTKMDEHCSKNDWVL
jgi:hypothetical protein